MKTKKWFSLMTVGVLAAFSSGVSADLIPAVDAWGSGSNPNVQNQETYTNGCYTAAAGCLNAIDGVKTSTGTPGWARNGGHGASWTNHWIYIDLGADYAVDHVNVYGDAQGLYGLNGYFAISTAPDGSEGTVVLSGGSRTSDGLWALDVSDWGGFTSDPNNSSWTLQAEGNANVEAWGQVGNWNQDNANEAGEELMVSIPLPAPVFARYVKVNATTTGYGGFAVAEIEAHGTIPEPASAAVIGLGGILLMIRRRRS